GIRGFDVPASREVDARSGSVRVSGGNFKAIAAPVDGDVDPRRVLRRKINSSVGYARDVLHCLIGPAAVGPVPLEVPLDAEELPALTGKVDLAAVLVESDQIEGRRSSFIYGVAREGGTNSNHRSGRGDRKGESFLHGSSASLAERYGQGSFQRARRSGEDGRGHVNHRTPFGIGAWEAGERLALAQDLLIGEAESVAGRLWAAVGGGKA